MLGAFFPNAVMVALTATANGMDRVKIKNSLHMNNTVEVIGNPDRKNIFYDKVLRETDELSSFESILRPIENKLLDENVNYPLTIIYLPLRWCGFAYKLFENILGKAQYYPPGSDAIPERRLFAQYHAPQTLAMKEMILAQLTSELSTIRIIFATVAIGMGVDIPSIREIIHIGPPSSIQQYFQETGRAGRDGKPSTAILYYNNRDIAKNKHIGDDMRGYCKLEDQCLRKFLLDYLNCGQLLCPMICHSCCSFCSLVCQCPNCNS